MLYRWNNFPSPLSRPALSPESFCGNGSGWVDGRMTLFANKSYVFEAEIAHVLDCGGIGSSFAC